MALQIINQLVLVLLVKLEVENSVVGAADCWLIELGIHAGRLIDMRDELGGK